MSNAAFSTASGAKSIRVAIAARCSDKSLPGSRRVAAAAAGISGADAFLCHLSRSIIEALEHLSAHAEAARVRINSAHDVAGVEAKSHSDELELCEETTETSKRVMLERELCAVDAALEVLRAEKGVLADADASLTDAELVSQHADLMARLEGAEAQLLALPTAVIELPYVGLVIDEHALLGGSAVFERVVAPRAITAADLIIAGAPCYAYPGCTLQLRLTIPDAIVSSQSAEEQEMSLGAAASTTHIDIAQKAPNAELQPLKVESSADVPGRSVAVSVVVPAAAPVGSSVCFGPLTVSGKPLSEPICAVLVRTSHLNMRSSCRAWLPRGGPPSPGAWQKVYRATIHGFGGRDFHARCDGRARLLVLIRTKEGGWLFGGFTAVGFKPSEGYSADAAAFLFSLTNSLGHPEKLGSRGRGHELYKSASVSAVFGGGGLDICSNADVYDYSYTKTGMAFTESASTGAHPMAQGRHATVAG